MKNFAISTLEKETIIAIGGFEHVLVWKDKVGCLLHSSAGAGLTEFYSYTELERIEEYGLLAVRVPAETVADNPSARHAVTKRERELTALFAAQYDDPSRPTMGDIHRALAAEIWSINVGLREGETQLRVPSLNVVTREIGKLLKKPDFGRRRALRTSRGI